MTKKFVFGALAALMLAASGPSQAQQRAANNVERFIDPAMVRGVELSPSGAYAAMIRRVENGEWIVVLDLASNTAVRVQFAAAPGYRFNWVSWKGEDRLLAGVTVMVTSEGRTETGSRARRTDDLTYRVQRVIAFNRDGSNMVQMFENQMRRLAWGWGSTAMLDPLPADPDRVLLMAADNSGIGVWRASVTSGRAERVANGTWDTTSYETDGANYPVMRRDLISDGSGYRFYRRASGASDWVLDREVRRADVATNSPDFQVVGAGPGPNQVYVIARTEQRDLSALYLFNTATGELGVPLYEGAAADVFAILTNPSTNELVFSCEYAQRLNCRARDPALQRHLTAIDGFFERNATVLLVQMSADSNRWLLHVEGPADAGGYYLYDRAQRSVMPVVGQYPSIDPAVLSPVQTVGYAARDGTQLWAYVTAKAAATPGPRPMVVMPHGGPEARDFFGYDPYAQFLASRGYVVLQPNFRGSSGFGRAFANAGRGQWGLRMQDDVTDAVQHMIAAGVADPQRICIAGASYGGYAALAGVTYTPNLYKCAISISGVTDLVNMLSAERRAAVGTSYEYWRHSMGDLNTQRDALIAVSPARNAARINAPVLLIHGALDESVPISQSDQMRQALQAAGKPVRYVAFPEADHYWDDWSAADRLTLYRETETFLAQHIGPGR